MTTERARMALNTILAAFLALPLPLVALVIRYGPLAPPSLPAWFLEWPGTFAAAAFALSFVLFFASLRRASLSGFLAFLIPVEGALIAGSVAAGLAVHRDFFTAAFQYALALPLPFLINARRAGRRGKPIIALSRAGYVLAAFYAQWIMMMGYAISTRAEPRPIESIVYNVYNLVLAIALFLASRALGLSGKHAVETGPDSLFVDGKDVTPAIGARKARILNAFATAPERTLRCPELQLALAGDEAALPEECHSCGADTKAASCGRYRVTYNGILELKKMLEFLEIGSIASGPNRRLVLSEGWRLILFEGIRLTAKKNKAPR
ncbi:MAG TPA: hypothetical protein PLU93_04750 [Treponemataceae bacterium]|nr:hypothetical protein [Treponemataceae bacterium]